MARLERKLAADLGRTMAMSVARVMMAAYMDVYTYTMLYYDIL